MNSNPPPKYMPDAAQILIYFYNKSLETDTEVQAEDHKSMQTTIRRFLQNIHTEKRVSFCLITIYILL